MTDDGTSPGVQCGAVHDIAGRCTRDMAHPGAHVARSSTPGHGFGGWRNRRPGEPDTTYVEVRLSDEKLRGIIGGTLARLGFVPLTGDAEAGPEGPASPESMDSRGLATGTAYPEHVTDSTLGCWCQPTRDPIDPEIIVHRRETRA